MYGSELNPRFYGIGCACFLWIKLKNNFTCKSGNSFLTQLYLPPTHCQLTRVKAKLDIKYIKAVKMLLEMERRKLILTIIIVQVITLS